MRTLIVVIAIVASSGCGSRQSKSGASQSSSADSALSSVSATSNPFSAAAATCVSDGDSCSSNSDCCSRECDYSNTKKACFPKLGSKVDPPTRTLASTTASTGQAVSYGRYEGEFHEDAEAFVLTSKSFPGVELRVPKRDAKKQPTDGKLMIESNAHIERVGAAGLPADPVLGGCFNLCCTATPTYPDRDCDTTCCLSGEAHVTCAPNGKANTSCNEF